MNALRRVRTYAGQFALLGVLALVAALLVTAAPRMANRLLDEGLREQVAAQPPAIRDITYEETPDRFEQGGGNRAEQLELRLTSMRPELRRVIGDRWYAGQTTPVLATGPDRRPGPPLVLALRYTTGGPDAVTMAEGRWPQESTDPSGPVEVALSVEVAEEVGLRPGSRLLARPTDLGATPQPLTIVGIFRPKNPADGVWDSLPSVLRTTPPLENGPVTAVGLTAESGIRSSQSARWPITYTWRYRVAPERLDASQAQPLIDSLRHLGRQIPRGHQLQLNTGLDIPLQQFVETLGAAGTVLGVVSAGVLATLGGLVILAARLAVRRRSEEFSLIRARGGAPRTVAGRSLAESLLVVPPAMVAGWVVGAAVPGRPGDTGWLAVSAAVITVLALPAAAVAARPAVGARRDLIRIRPSTRRLTVEVSLLAFAALGTFLLRRRGLPPGGAVDPLLASVPVLLAVAAAVLALRAYPWPLRLASRLAARARGTVAFLGLARAGRSTVTGPLIVVVVAVATAAFCGVVATGIEDGRDRAAGLAVPADALISDGLFAPETADDLAALPGVRSVVPLVAQPAQEISRTADRARSGLDGAFVLVVDGPAFARVVSESGAEIDVPRALAAAAAGTGPVPAVVSPAVAADLSGRGFVTAQQKRFEFQITTVASAFPTIPRDTDRFVVLPRQALPGSERASLIPTGFLVAASSIDQPTLQRTGDEGQRRYFTSGLITGKKPARPCAVTLRATVRGDLGRGGANGLLFFGFGAGVLGGTVLGLLAIAFAVLAGARARGRVLSRLRTMGLSRPQSRGLLIVELAPLVGAAVLTGAAVGVLLPLLLTPALGLATFTDGMPVRVRLEAGLFGGVVVLGALALLTAITVEAMFNRRLRLGEVLRLGEES